MKRIILLTLTLLLLSGMTAWGFHLIQERHNEVFKLVRNAAELISKARGNQINRYAPEQFGNAEELYSKALDKWREENHKWVVNRDFSEIEAIANEIEIVIASAIEKSSQEKSRLQDVYNSLDKKIEAGVNRFETFYTYLPLPDSIRAGFTRGRLLFLEAGIAREAGDNHQAYARINQASGLITGAVNFGSELLTAYFENFGYWNRLNNEALAVSRERPVIMVDKVARRLFVYENGRVTLELKTDLGPNWVGTKMREGDLTTPEGTYRVVRKREGRNTIYYKALLINYPNEDDMARFRRNLREGVIPKGSRVGGLIQIHGKGGRGIDWTKGCVAVTNQEMDKLFKIVEVGTPVYIVGSLEPLSTYLERGTLRPAR